MSRFKFNPGFLDDKNANVAIIFGLTAFMLVGFCALSVDVGSFYYGKRKLQSSTDLAALAAAADLTHAQNAATATLGQNGYLPSTLLNVQPGIYTSDPTIAPSQRFVAQATANSSTNAVQLTTQTTTPMIFGTIFGMGSTNASPPSGNTGNHNVTLGAKAIAAQASFASFTIGSGVASVNNGILNAILGSLLGGNVSLSLADYQSLASANIDLFSFSKALATRVNLNAVTYSQIANANVQLGDVLNAIVDTASATPGFNSQALSALSQIAAAQGISTQMTIAPLVSFGPYAQNIVGTAPISATMSAFNIVSLLAQLANGTHEVQVNLGVNIPGITNSSLLIEFGQPTTGMSVASIGAQSSTARTFQTRILLTVQLAVTGQTALLNLPIYFDIAPGTAQLTAVQCTPGNVASSTVTLSVTPALTNIWVGTVSTANYNNMGAPLAPSAATVFNLLNLATITAYANASLSNLNPTPVTYSYNDILQGTAKTTSTTDYVAQLVSSLLGNLQLTVNVLGFGFSIPNGLTSAITTAAVNASAPVDQLVYSLLTSLGINVGNATTWVTGVTCGNSVLVN